MLPISAWKAMKMDLIVMLVARPRFDPTSNPTLLDIMLPSPANTQQALPRCGYAATRRACVCVPTDAGMLFTQLSSA